ncbi:hypothetical protein MMPV_000508 [Pyropia vietnamensis]
MAATSPGGATPPSTRLEDRDVPEGHSDLHSFLYSGGDEEHAPATADATAGSAEAIRFTSDGTRRLPVPVFLAGLSDNERVAGVYKVFAADSTLMYVGLSRNVEAALRAHLAVHGRSSVASMVVKTWDFPVRSEMAATVEEWLSAAAPAIPVGNSPEGAARWASSAQDVSAVVGRVPGEEEKKLKLRKAMADMTLVDEAEAADRAAAAAEAAAGGNGSAAADARRANLASAINEGDWSGEIDAQTAETLSPPTAAAAAAVAPVGVASPMVSPFAASASASTGGAPIVDGDGPASSAGTAPMELTVANVDTVLDEVRPYLLSDGGNISVVSVDAASSAVVLRLEGACGSCASSTTTMKMGVERVLRETWPNLGDVTAVSEAAGAAFGVAAVEAALDNVRGALRGLGGSVSCLSATADGQVVLLYAGPPKLAYGIELMLRDSVPGTVGVTFTDDDEDDA